MKKAITFLLIVISLKVSAQSGITWNTGMNISSSADGNEHPRIAVNGSENPLVIWHDAGRAMFSRWNGTTFVAPFRLNSDPVFSVAGASWMGPDIAAHGDTVYVVFKQTPEASDTCHIFCVHSYDGGISFSTPVKVDIGDSITRFPTVTTDDLGNPIVGFMKFDPAFDNARWVVAKSIDFGNTFSPDVKASGYSSMTSNVCDCCPGSIVCAGNNAAMLYRDNNSNIRDSWAGLSTDGGNSFPNGMGIDQQNWMIMMCPSSGPDGVIIGDTLYSTFMNGISGTSLVYLNKSSLSAATGSAGVQITGSVSGLSQQNYPRIAASGSALAVVWKQIVNGADQCVLRFTNDIDNGLPAAYDTVDLSNITNADVAVTSGNIFVVWEDDASGTIKYRSGSFTPLTVAVNEISQNDFSVYPNPTSDLLNIQLDIREECKILITDILGQQIFSQQISSGQNNFQVKTSDWNNGMYFISVQNGKTIDTQKILVHHQ
jgi:hypothetical protein